MQDSVTIFWFRRDLRMEDNAGLFHALRDNDNVLPLFIFDREILDLLEQKADRRVEFIHQTLARLQDSLISIGSSLDVRYGKPLEIFSGLMKEYSIRNVYTNHDYEPYARDRDLAVATLLKEQGIPLHTYKDHVLFEKDEVLTGEGRPYTVFTPYSKRWKTLLEQRPQSSWSVSPLADHFFRQSPRAILSLESIGFRAVGKPFPPLRLSEGLLMDYSKTRDFPALDEGTSHLGIHLRFGTCSIRQVLKRALKYSDVFVNELIWRDFYHMILWHFPSVGRGKAFKPAYEWIPWRNDEADFDRWRKGSTGYPIVDAGMRQLNDTGYMHNRIRMVVASFLTRHLLIDWRWGEAWFAEKLLDFDLAANNGGWQWAAGSGCDAAPYFRIFNPARQAEKFDPDGVYVRRWVPESTDGDYPPPMVEHSFARARALEVYGRALKNHKET